CASHQEYWGDPSFYWFFDIW
nr:immunoglobulin heavy chain junction region [Macaca mulatta]